MSFYQTAANLHYKTIEPNPLLAKLVSDGMKGLKENHVTAEGALEQIALTAGVQEIESERVLLNAVKAVGPYTCSSTIQKTAQTWMEINPDSELIEYWKELTSYEGGKKCCGGCKLKPKKE